MPFKLSFDRSKDHPYSLQLANNIKLAFAQQIASKKLNLTVDNDNHEVQLTNNEGFQLFDANAILRYIMDDFEGLNSEEYNYSLSLECVLYHEKTQETRVDYSSEKALNSLSNLKQLNAIKVITFANLYSLSKDFKITFVPDSLSKAILVAKSQTPRSPSLFVHTGVSNIESGYQVKRNNEKILPKEGERNILITSALPYVNNIPHLGNIIGSVLSADIYSRYCKSRNYNTLFICGTDEYGTATETKALKEGVTPRELCDKYHAIHADIYRWFQIGFDYFGRTTTEKQTEIAQDIFIKLKENGYLEEHSMKQLYCSEHKGYLADRYVEGECPKCHYEDARGDQCDQCGYLLDSFELINPHCKLDNATPEPRYSDHIFLSLDKLESAITQWNDKASSEGFWSKNSKNITQSWLKEGLLPRCITRDLVWGTPVPLEKFKEKVLYVWFDATIGYISITANYTKDWEKWWKNPENVSLYQFMGKDNVPFHTVIFPGTQLGTGEKWTMLHHLNTTEYLQYEGGKFSKSRGIGVFGNNAQEIGVSPSVWRYYLASVRPESSDSQFSWNDFISRNNNELLANLGNFVNRLIKFVNAKYNGVVPEYDIENLPDNKKLLTNLNQILSDYVNAMEGVHERRGLEVAMSLSSRGNQFLQENKLDNSLFSQYPLRSDAVVGVGLNIIYAVASLIGPYLPETAETIYRMLNAPELMIDDTFHLVIKGGHNINKAEYLFHRIDEKQGNHWGSKYGNK